jgi:hypothetical protein
VARALSDAGLLEVDYEWREIPVYAEDNSQRKQQEKSESAQLRVGGPRTVPVALLQWLAESQGHPVFERQCGMTGSTISAEEVNEELVRSALSRLPTVVQQEVEEHMQHLQGRDGVSNCRALRLSLLSMVLENPEAQLWLVRNGLAGVVFAMEDSEMDMLAPRGTLTLGRYGTYTPPGKRIAGGRGASPKAQVVEVAVTKGGQSFANALLTSFFNSGPEVYSCKRGWA